jgi:caffeoyl-CoA O-methyltransferase
MDAIRHIYAYCERYSTPPSPVLAALERQTHLRTLAPQMLSGHLQGHFLRLLSRLLRPEVILEIGTFTGYGAICLAEGLAPGGRLHTIEINPEMAPIIQEHLAAAGLLPQARLHIGDAFHIIPTLPEPYFDLVFLDAGKQDYAAFHDLTIERVRPGGLLIADNVLWSGKALDPGDDPDALALHRFNEKVRGDERVECLMLPLRDGLMLMRKL